MPATQADTFAQIRALGFSVRKVDGEIQIKPIGSRWDGAETYFTDDLDDALGTARDLAARGFACLHGRALAVIEKARAAGCRVDAGNAVDLLADNIPATLSDLREVVESLDLPASDAGAPVAEGFRIYIPSREALEALERAVNDELTRATDSLNVWTNRAAHASADKWRGECVRLVEISRQRTEALLVALLAIRRQDG